MADKWLAWERISRSRHSEKTVMLKLESEGPMKYFQLRGPATEDEILAEVGRRAERQSELDAERELHSRPEYSHAKAIHDYLEWMTPADHPLDRLTLDEWATLRQRITRGQS